MAKTIQGEASGPATDGPIAGIVLAAGRSSRMGQPKALLDVDGSTFVDRCVRVLHAGGCDDVVVVVAGAEADGIHPLVERAGAKSIVNPDPDSQQIDSLRLGLDALPEATEAAAVLPVDRPLVRQSTAAALINAFRAPADPGALIIRPVHAGDPGHPTLFARTLFPELRQPALPHGAETVVERHAGEIRDIQVDDPGVLANIDTLEAYRRFVEAA